MNNGDVLEADGGGVMQPDGAAAHFHPPEPHVAAQIEVVRYWTESQLTVALKIRSYGNPEYVQSEVLAGAIANGVWSNTDLRFDEAVLELYRRAAAAARGLSRRNRDWPESRTDEIACEAADMVVDQLLRSRPGSFLACRFGLVVSRAYSAVCRRYSREYETRTEDAMTGTDGAVTTHTDEAGDPMAMAEFDAIEDRDRIQAAIADLPERHREALLLTAVYGCTHAEAAKRLGVSDRTIRTWCSNAAAQARRQLGEA